MSDINLKLDLGLEDQLEKIRDDIGDIQYDVRIIQATQGVLVNYIQLLIEERGLKEKAAHLEKKIEAIRVQDAAEGR